VTLVWGIGGVVGAKVFAAPQAQSDAPANKRLMYRFDFDERSDGNLEQVPKYWDPLRMQGFPGFATGAFDTTVGHLAPPSFRLESRGRNVAYEYGGPDLTVRASGNYRVSAFLRPDRLKNARTCLSAFFRDRSGNPILETLVRTAYFSSSDSSNEWIPVQLLLPGAPTEAATIGMAVWVLQESTWDTSTEVAREIKRVDVHGGVWIDDISVITLPRVTLETSTAGNVLEPADKAELIIHASDHQRGSMDSSLTVLDATGKVVMVREFTISLGGAMRPMAISIEELPVGWYNAILSVSAEGAHILDRRLSFVRVAASLSDSSRATASFGISITPGRRSQPSTELALLERQLARSTKIPVWSLHHDMSPGSSYAREHDVLLQELLQRGFALTAVLAELPMSLASTYGAFPYTAVELLADSPGLWQDELAKVAAPYASTYRWWQVGGDGDPVDAFSDMYSRAVEQVRDTLGPYILLPRMTAALSYGTDPQASKIPVEQITVTIDASVAVERVGPVIEALRSKGYEQVSALIESFDAAKFDRMGRLANWAQRLIAARHGGASVVYTRPTWRVRDTPFGTVTEPREEFILLRTLANVIRDAQPGPKVPLLNGVQGFAFNVSGDEVVLALWDPTAPPKGREHSIQLGTATQVIDLWGRVDSLERDEGGRHRIRLTNMPVLVPGIERWLVDFRSSFSIVPDRVEPGQELVEHRVESTYFGATPVIGRAALKAPDDWQVTPRGFSISYSSGERTESVQEIHYSHRESAGVKDVPLQIVLDNNNYFLEVPLQVEIVLADLQVRGAAIMEGETLIVDHYVRNRTDQTLNLRGSIAVPGKLRQYRPLTAIPPGGMRRVEYRFREARGLAGRRILLGIREMSDNPRVHNLELTVP